MEGTGTVPWSRFAKSDNTNPCSVLLRPFTTTSTPATPINSEEFPKAVIHHIMHVMNTLKIYQHNQIMFVIFLCAPLGKSILGYLSTRRKSKVDVEEENFTAVDRSAGGPRCKPGKVTVMVLRFCVTLG